jgi:ABC-type bacteriocin/lantibiotic exporter with double-glycine peptidase domain
MPKALLPNIPALNVPHRSQTQQADCLAACAAMVLSHFEITVPYNRLLSLLNIGKIGAPRRNILNLTQLGINVIYREATLSILAEYLQAGIPVIAFVDTNELPYWTIVSNHAITIVGLDNDTVIALDPAFEASLFSIPRGDFELAWGNADYACAIISPQ